MQKVMDEKTKELIAIGASVSAHCQPCLTYHVAKAKELYDFAQTHKDKPKVPKSKVPGPKSKVPGPKKPAAKKDKPADSASGAE